MGQGAPQGTVPRSLKIGGRDAATVSFRVNAAGKDLAYVRVMLMQTAVSGLSYLYGSAGAADDILNDLTLL
ncbi:hypothetical protein [Nonomuraea endophytica]|uniref:hypothetical protein n=1 Tax=Nonomuraea endophytica TaxID=714136 RepID=UPI0037C6B60D